MSAARWTTTSCRTRWAPSSWPGPSTSRRRSSPSPRSRSWASASRPTSRPGDGSCSTPRTTSTSPPTGRSSPAPRSSSPSSPSTTSATDCATRWIRGRFWRDDRRRSLLHPGHRAGRALPPSQGLAARADPCGSRANREGEPVAQRLLHGRGRAGARRRPARHRRAQARRRARSPARPSGLDQGPDAHPGDPHDRGLEDLRAPRPRARRPGRRAAEGGGRDRPRQDQQSRVRRRREHLQRGLRPDADPALMLAAIAGPDPRAPLSYAVDTRTFTRAVRAPGIKGLRIAWGGGLGITPVDDEVLGVCHAATAVLRALGARVDEAHPDFDGLHEIVDVSRGASMVARHADRLGKWRGVMQENLVKNIEYGLTLTATDIGRAERIRTALWHRVREFYTRYDLIVTPTTAVPPFPVAVVYPRAEERRVGKECRSRWSPYH